MLKRLRVRGGLFLAVLLGILSANVAAHELPGDVTVQAWLKPEGQRLRFIVRVPLIAMRDMEYPTRGDKAIGILDISRAERTLHDAATLWVAEQVEMYEGDTRLPLPTVVRVRASLPSDKSFASYDEALAHVNARPLPDDIDLQWKEGMLDVLFEYPIQSDQSRFSIDSRLNRLGLRTVTALRLVLPNGTIRAFDLHGDAGLVRLDPRWHQAALRFVVLGFEHILDGIDHLLFLFCLVIPFRRLRALVAVVTSSTVAHSITLIASAYNLTPDALRFPPLIETLIAISIVYMAFENIVGAKLQRRWIVTFAFGLVHGFGFSFLLRERLQFAGEHLVASLLAFNVGVEIGQLAVLLVTIPVLSLIFRYVVAERMGTILMSALVAHTAWHWALDRGNTLLGYRVPAFTLQDMAAGVRLLMVIIGAAGLVWLVSNWLGSPRGFDTKVQDEGS